MQEPQKYSPHFLALKIYNTYFSKEFTRNISQNSKLTIKNYLDKILSDSCRLSPKLVHITSYSLYKIILKQFNDNSEYNIAHLGSFFLVNKMTDKELTDSIIYIGHQIDPQLSTLLGLVEAIDEIQKIQNNETCYFPLQNINYINTKLGDVNSFTTQKQVGNIMGIQTEKNNLNNLSFVPNSLSFVPNNVSFLPNNLPDNQSKSIFSHNQSNNLSFNLPNNQSNNESLINSKSIFSSMSNISENSKKTIPQNNLSNPFFNMSGASITIPKLRHLHTPNDCTLSPYPNPHCSCIQTGECNLVECFYFDKNLETIPCAPWNLCFVCEKIRNDQIHSSNCNILNPCSDCIEKSKKTHLFDFPPSDTFTEDDFIYSNYIQNEFK
jgi:hypothetical protein